VKWLEFSSDDFESIPDIQFSWKKPLIAASVVLKYEKTAAGLQSTAEVKAKIPIKGLFHYLIEARSAKSSAPRSGAGKRSNGESANDTFSFSDLKESDLSGGNRRETHAKGSTLSIKKSSPAGVVNESVELINDSTSPILAPLFVLPAFRQTHDSRTSIYAGHIVVGAKIQALRIEKISHSGETESYEGKLISVLRALSEHEWGALPWESKKGFGFDWDLKNQTVSAARFSVPIFGQIEIKS
jgi:hypothetical protein